MLLLDSNVLIRTFRADLYGQVGVADWFRQLIDSKTRFGFPDGILMSFVRIVTQAPLNPVTPIDVALEFATKFRSLPACQVVPADLQQWETFVRVCSRMKAHGRRAQDVYWASFALSHDLEWLTFDAGFRHVPGLRWRSPLDHETRTNPR